MVELPINKFKEDKIRVLLILDEEQLAFLADLGISEAQQIILQNLAFQTKDFDAYDSDCDDLSSAIAVLMANISSCDPEVLSEIPYSDSYPNDMINQNVQEMQYYEQTQINYFPDNEIHSDSIIILYSQYLQESQDAVIQDTNSSTPNDLLVLSLVEQMTDHVAHLDKENQKNKMEKLIDSQMDDLIRDRNAKLAAFQQEIDTFKQTLSNNVKEKESLSKTLTVFKTESKEKESKYIDKEIILKKQNKELENIILDFGKCFVTQKELSAEQAFWLKHSNYNPDTSVKSHTPVRIEAPSKLPKVSLVNESLKKLKYQLASFDKVMKKRTTFDTITADEINEVQTVFNQMEAAVDQCFVDKNA
ncbi:hypothetical protein Tco_1480840, partial [Tanacetum coccineum]